MQYKTTHASEDAPSVLIYSYIYYRNISHLHELSTHVYGEISSMQLCNHTQGIIKQHMVLKIQLICWFLVTFTKSHHYFVISQCMANTSEESHAVVGLYLHYHQEYLTPTWTTNTQYLRGLSEITTSIIIFF